MTIPETSAVGAAHEVITLLVNNEADDVEEAAKVTTNVIIEEPATSNVAASKVSVRSRLLESEIFEHQVIYKTM